MRLHLQRQVDNTVLLEKPLIVFLCKPSSPRIRAHYNVVVWSDKPGKPADDASQQIEVLERFLPVLLLDFFLFLWGKEAQLFIPRRGCCTGAVVRFAKVTWNQTPVSFQGWKIVEISTPLGHCEQSTKPAMSVCDYQRRCQNWKCLHSFYTSNFHSANRGQLTMSIFNKVFLWTMRQLDLLESLQAYVL